MVELLNCQKQAVAEWVAKKGRAILSADVGSGKSFVAAACFKVSMDKYPAPALYLTTKTAMKEQVKKFEDYGLTVIPVDGIATMRIKLWSNPQPVVYVATLQAIACPEKEWRIMRTISFGCLIVDEADQLTAGASKRNRRLLMLNPRHRLLMSGTMLKNGLKDSYFPVMFLSWNSPWKNWTDFKNKELLFKNPMVPNMITGIRDERYLADLMKPLIITMENPDSPKELVAHIIKCDMGMDQRAAYETMKEELILEAKNGTLTISNHAVLNLRCRQFVAMPEALGHDASSAKEEALAELLPTLTGKTIIFTSFATVARILSERYKWPIIEGATSARNRKEILESAPDILVCTSAGERGVDCPWVTNIISLDAGFTSAVIRQRAGRATRYGRTGEAKLFLIQCKDSVDIYSEERIILRKLKEARKVCMAQSHSR